MPKYAQYDPSAAAPAPVTGCLDTDTLPALRLPASGALLLTAAQWDAHWSGQWAVSAGALVPYTQPAPVLPPAQQAQAALSAGLTITSASLGISGAVFAVNTDGSGSACVGRDPHSA